MIAILAIALISQTIGDAAVVRGDLEFTRAVEESVRSWAVRVPDVVMLKAMEALGSAHYEFRETASRLIEAHCRSNPEDARWLFWGRMRRDPEVRLRCNAILRRLNPCPTCDGKGVSRNWSEWPCYECQGTATAWPYSMWD